jgi:hypothetical protein
MAEARTKLHLSAFTSHRYHFIDGPDLTWRNVNHTPEVDL